VAVDAHALCSFVGFASVAPDGIMHATTCNEGGTIRRHGATMLSALPPGSMQHHRFVRFTLGDLDFALALYSVERIVRAVAIAPLPGAPAAVLGLVTVRGEVLPVADMRRRFGLAPRPVHLHDHLVIARSARRRWGLVVQAACDVVECEDDEVIPPESVVPGLEHVHGIARTPDGLLLVHDLDRFLALDEEAALQEALERG
jgi:purine-binding chemotaxis protein CheW